MKRWAWVKLLVIYGGELWVYFDGRIEMVLGSMRMVGYLFCRLLCSGGVMNVWIGWRRLLWIDEDECLLCLLGLVGKREMRDRCCGVFGCRMKWVDVKTKSTQPRLLPKTSNLLSFSLYLPHSTHSEPKP